MGDDGDIGSVARGQPREPRNPTLTLEVATEGPAWTCLAARRPASLARRVASALAQSHQLPARRTTATLLLSTDANVRVLNKQWRGIDKPTNVLSFPSPAAPSPRARTASARHLGDLILAEQTLEREAGEMGIDVADHYRHLVLHGLLHLLGHDHETDAEAEMMEALETRILASLGVADPYAGSEPVKSSTAAPQRGLQGARAR